MEHQENEFLDTSAAETMSATDETSASSTQEQTNEQAPIVDTEKLSAELAEQKDKYLRLFAEFENYKRRTSKERIELISTAGKDIMVSLLDVLDDADRAEKNLEQSNDFTTQKEGVQLVFNKLRTQLQQKGLKAFDSIKQDFDVEKHEAITEIPAPAEELKGKVIDEVQKGYMLGEKIIRFAKVVVGK
jgi:molecular chaperone GrpE